MPSSLTQESRERASEDPDFFFNAGIRNIEKGV